jgi:hypothetical protein
MMTRTQLNGRELMLLKAESIPILDAVSTQQLWSGKQGIGLGFDISTLQLCEISGEGL